MPEFMLPLPQSYNVKTNPQDGNKGLYYDKFCDRWHRNGKNWSMETYQDNNGTGDPKLEWIKTISGTRCGLPEEINQFIIRQRKLVEFLQGNYRIYKTGGKFVTGLGRPHPVENGFTWHPTLGAPYLPGSSIKGLVRNWIESGWSGESVDPVSFHRIFGSEFRIKSPLHPLNKNLLNQQGSIRFLDAIPVKPVKIEPEIMTPHYGPYYSGKEAPGDWQNPVPIPFLTVSDAQYFQFAMIPQKKANCDDIKLVLEWLDHSLTCLGAGAKTANGYGTFVHDSEAEKQSLREDQDRQRRDAETKSLKSSMAGKSHLFQELIQQAASSNWSSNKDAFVKPGAIESWLDKLEDTPDSDSLKFLKQLIDFHFTPKLLNNPDEVKGKKSKPTFTPRQVQFAKRMIALLMHEDDH